MLGTGKSWITFLSGAGAIVLTFLAGAELDPAVFKTKWKEASAVGVVGFIAPFLGCAAAAHFLLHWDVRPSWLAGVALSTTSVAVVYAVMLEFGLNRTDYGKTMLAACFINDLLTVLALGLIFAPFTRQDAGLRRRLARCVFAVLPWLTPRFFRWYGGRPSELEAKFLLLTLFGLGALAAWADSEAVLPAYIVGMVLAGTVGKDHVLVRRLRTLTFGLLTPFYFIRAGSFVSVPALVAAPVAFVILLGAKMATKFAASSPPPSCSKRRREEAMYTTLLMSTGLTFGTISSLFGLSHHIITQAQYSLLVAAVDRQRRRPHPDRQRLLPAPPPAAERGGAGGRGDGRRPAADACRHTTVRARCSRRSWRPMTAPTMPFMRWRWRSPWRGNAAQTFIWFRSRRFPLPGTIEKVREETGTASRRFHAVLQRARAMAEERQIDLKTHVLAGHPVRDIVDLARELKADLLVVGGSGHSALYDRMIGSRASRIVHLAHCPVLVVK